jgi:hypothetical protein
MGRHQSNTVEYFPHIAKHGKTLFILKSRFGNDGYAFWFQLLEILCLAENHYYDCRDEEAWQYLLSVTGVDEISGTQILSLLAKLGKIDAELWDTKMIWCQKLVSNLEDVYKKRGRPVPQRPRQLDNNHETATDKTIAATEIHKSVTETPQSKVKESKVNNTIARFQRFWEMYPKKKSKGVAEKAFAQLNPDEQLLATMLATIERAKKSDDWLKEGGKFIPYPATWLRAKGWLDVIEEGGLSSARTIGNRVPQQYTRPEDL